MIRLFKQSKWFRLVRYSDVPTSSSGSDQIRSDQIRSDQIRSTQLSSARQFRYKPEKPKKPESLKA